MIALSASGFVIQADRFELARCRCPMCLVLDVQFPHQGYQLALFPYRPVAGGTRTPRAGNHIVRRRP